MSELIQPKHILVTGGSRSGKSQFAETQATLLTGRVVYLATAEVQDMEMKQRIVKHQQRRPSEWITVEASLQVKETLELYQSGYTVLLDCLTMYLSNLYFKYERDVPGEEISQLIDQAMTDLTKVITSSTANLVIVTNEVGWGIVPENPLARIFRDLAGLCNQQIAAVCDEVYLVVSGVPLKIKGAGNV